MPIKLTESTLINRGVAKVLDLVILLLITYPLHFLFSPLSDLIAVAFIFCVDAFPEGRSPGKRMLHLKTVHSETGAACNLKQSIIRNIPFGILVFCAVIPPSIGYVFIFFLALPLIILEVYFLLTLDPKRRYCDIIADTSVVEALDEDPDKLVENK